MLLFAGIFDGVVESPIYCVTAVFQKLGILHVLPPSLNNHCAFLSRFFLAGVYGTFYLAIGYIFYEFIGFDVTGDLI